MKTGFGALDPAKQREIAAQGGRAAHAKGTTPKFTAESAREAGRKGGTAVSQDREHMKAIGAAGGRSRARKAKSAHRTQDWKGKPTPEPEPEP